MSKLKYLLILCMFGMFTQAQYVYWEPEIPVPGGEITIYYNTFEGALPDYSSAIYIHLGYNGWQDTEDYAMSFEGVLDEGWWWSYTYSIPLDAETVDFVFTDLLGNWDNNGGVGVDWHISLNYYWTPFNPGPGDPVQIVLNNVDMGGEIAWTVNAGSGHTIPIEDYWPNASYAEDGWLLSPLTAGRDNYGIELGPFDMGEQIVQTIKFRIRWADGSWDMGENGQVINYDIYFDYTPPAGAPYVFWVTPAEGGEYNDLVNISVVGSASSVEFWVNSENIGSDNSSPFELAWVPDDQLFGDVTIVARAEGSNGLLTYLFRTIHLSFEVVHEPVPVGSDDGLNISGNDIVITLYAPAKEYVTLKGSWNQEITAGEMMKLSGDTLWWYQATLPDGDYTYQFNIEGIKDIADPWSKDVYWKDPSGIYESGYYGDAKTNFSIGEDPFEWTDQTFNIPEMRNVIVYELHVDDFAGYNDEFGTYQEVIAKIEAGYFNDLGVTALEFMPLNEFEGSYSWGYNPTFYMAPETTYGTPEELKQLVNTAHQYGLAVLMDVVFNHLWGSAPLFQLYQPLDNYNYEDHDYQNCPYFHNQESQWGYKLQHWSPRTRKHIDDVLMTWVQDYHFDGFRFDVTPGIGWDPSGNYGSTHYGNMLNAYNPDLIIIAEEDNSYQINNTGFDAGWDYSYYHMIKANLMQFTDGGHSWGDMVDLGNHIRAGNQGYNTYTGPLVYVESHDESRIMYEAIHYQGMSEETAVKKSKLGAVTLFTSQGTPMIYHGQEFGQNGTSQSGGGIQPQPLQWFRLNSDEGADLFDTYQSLIALRQNYEVLRSWDLDVRYQSNGNKCIVYWRVSGDEEVIVAANFNSSDRTIDIEFPHNGTWYNYLDGSEINIETNWFGGYTIPASTAIVFLNEIPDFNDVVLIGDANFDGGIDVLDIVLIVDYILNGPMPLGNAFTAADINADGGLDVLDIVALVAIILG